MSDDETEGLPNLDQPWPLVRDPRTAILDAAAHGALQAMLPAAIILASDRLSAAIVAAAQKIARHDV